MNTITIKSIIISPDRQRQEFDPEALTELMNSISENGLFHAPVMRETDKGLVLVSGERRLRAMGDMIALGMPIQYNGQTIPPGEIPYTTLGELTPLQAEEAELDENLRRRDLTWQELAQAHERLRDLRQKQADANTPNILPAATITPADIAQEIHGRSDGAYQEKVRREFIVAKHLDDPEVAAAKSVDDAFKLLKKKETMEKNIALAESVGKTFSSDIHQLHCIDCLSWMAAYADCEGTEFTPQVDVICTDPPYGMGAAQFNDGGGKMTNITHTYDDSHDSWIKLMEEWARLSYLVCKPQAHAYVFCDIDRFHELKAMMQLAGWYVFRTPLLHYKPNSGRVPLPDRGPRRQYELILYAIKGNKPVTHIYPDVIATNADEQLYHGAQKPVALFKNLLQRSVHPGDVVLDCFAGTGPVIPAAHSLQCKAIVIEQEREWYAECVKRVEGLKNE